MIAAIRQDFPFIVKTVLFSILALVIYAVLMQYHTEPVFLLLVIAFRLFVGFGLGFAVAVGYSIGRLLRVPGFQARFLKVFFGTGFIITCVLIVFNLIKQYLF